jgi:hypothetical protein
MLGRKPLGVIKTPFCTTLESTPVNSLTIEPMQNVGVSRYVYGIHGIIAKVIIYGIVVVGIVLTILAFLAIIPH